MKNAKQAQAVIDSTKQGLEKINQAEIPGKLKVWIVQFMLIPKLLWPLTIYEIGMSAVEQVEKKISYYTRKWLGLPPGLTTLALYSRQAKLRLPLRSVMEEYKVGKVRSQMMQKHSGDSFVRDSGIQVKSGRKWKAAAATEVAEQDSGTSSEQLR